MGNILFIITLGVLSLNFFTITYRVNGLNRLIHNVPISLFETSIPIIEESDELTLYYDKELLENKLTSYFDKSIYKYTDEYRVTFYYYNQEDESICKGDKCDAIEITLKAKIDLFSEFKKTARFYIQKN